MAFLRHGEPERLKEPNHHNHHEQNRLKVCKMALKIGNDPAEIIRYRDLATRKTGIFGMKEDGISTARRPSMKM